MTTIECPGAHDLREVIRETDMEVTRLLQAGSRETLQVVGWLSAHLAALDQSVHPTARRRLSDGRQAVGEQRELTRRLSRLLRIIERHHSGDVLASAFDPVRLRDELVALLAAHRDAEHDLLDRLVPQLSAGEHRELAASYLKALGHAPTRPHPHLSPAGRLSGALFWADSVRDRLLDTMDGRHVPVQRVDRSRPAPGRWGAYVLGRQQDGAAD